SLCSGVSSPGRFLPGPPVPTWGYLVISLFGPAATMCDGISRREMLRIGALTMTGLALPELLGQSAVAKHAAPKSSSFGKARNCIILSLSGGASHHDPFDRKPAAPAEIRGEFNTIPTPLPGVRVSEHLPRSAKLLDRVALVRSMTHKNPDHAT